jgi:hypothetical protein
MQRTCVEQGREWTKIGEPLGKHGPSQDKQRAKKISKSILTCVTPTNSHCLFVPNHSCTMLSWLSHFPKALTRPNGRPTTKFQFTLVSLHRSSPRTLVTTPPSRPLHQQSPTPTRRLSPPTYIPVSAMTPSIDNYAEYLDRHYYSSAASSGGMPSFAFAFE